MPKYDEDSELRMWNVQCKKATIPKMDRAMRKYSDEIKKATGYRVRVTYGMVLEKIVDEYLKGD